MAWVRVETNFPDHDKVLDAAARLDGSRPSKLRIGATATGRVMAVWLSATCYANAHLTDGFISDAVVQLFRADFESSKVMRAMAGRNALTRRVRGGWQLVNYDKYQLLKKEIQETRKKARDRMKGVRANIPSTASELQAQCEHSSDAVQVLLTDLPDLPMDLQDQDPSRLRRAPLTLVPIQNVRTHLLSAVHTALDADSTLADSELAEVTKVAAAKLSAAYDGRAVTRIIDTVRGVRAKRKAG